MTRSELRGLVEDDAAANGKSKIGKRILTLLSDDVKSIRMVFLPEDEVPGEVGHQADVAGRAKFQTRADLTQRSGVMIINRISGQVFALIGNEVAGVRVFLIEKPVERSSTV